MDVQIGPKTEVTKDRSGHTPILVIKVAIRQSRRSNSHQAI